MYPTRTASRQRVPHHHWQLLISIGYGRYKNIPSPFFATSVEQQLNHRQWTVAANRHGRLLTQLLPLLQSRLQTLRALHTTEQLITIL
jgi:hypothetical protein